MAAVGTGYSTTAIVLVLFILLVIVTKGFIY